MTTEDTLPSDWADINALIADMKQFATEHPDYEFMCADDPGNSPIRAPRFGWTAFKVEGDVELSKLWTIKVRDVRRGDDPILLVLETQTTRKNHLAAMIGR